MSDMPVEREAADPSAPQNIRPRAGAQLPAGKVSAVSVEADAQATQGAGNLTTARRHAGARWWLVASLFAALLIVITVGGIYLITKKPSTVDQLVILTVPSGADIKLDSKDYGNSPVKLEQVHIGTYTLTITKDGYEPIVEQITVSESQPFEYKLKLLPPSDVSNLSPEEQLKRFQDRAELEFTMGNYGPPHEGSSLFFADQMLGLDPTNEFAGAMRERVRKALHQSAQAAMSRGDMGQAQEIYSYLVDYYPEDAEARAAALRLENQLMSRQGEVRDLVKKAEEALKAGSLVEPSRASAYFYSKQALAIDRQNAQARAIRNQVRERLAAGAEQEAAQGGLDNAIKQLEDAAQMFPEDKSLRARLRELEARKTTEVAKAGDPITRRVEGLAHHRNQDFAQAIPDLEYALLNGRGTTDVIFALAHSHMKLGNLDAAASYFRRVPPLAGDAYRSAIGALGDIAMMRGDTAAALERYKEARQLGGSPLYSVQTLEDKIEKIENKQREKADEPTPVYVRVKHLHGGLLKGSCSGTLTINSTGVRYEGGEHVFSSNLMGVNVRISKDEMILQFSNKPEKFKAVGSEAERFREALGRYQSHFSVKK